ncbi:MAG: GFA family protein [Albidovulum sp.]
MNDANHLHGSCLCGGVAFEVTGPFRDVIACHCAACRKSSGHHWGASSVPLEQFRMIRNDTLRWYVSSDRARRGFCGQCGASLLWDPVGEGRMGFAPGSIDGASGLKTAKHIFTEDAGDYYVPESSPSKSNATPETLSCTCLCQETAFTLPGPAGPITACHCAQCRKLSGYYAASFDANEADVEWVSRGLLAEFQTPGGGRRGFCGGCGSSLYFRSAKNEFSVEAGVVNGPTGGKLCDHIFVGDKGDYYAIDDGLPQQGGW